ncbi:hypothetical protein PIB30_073708 [Stylosanthes scabra]|uniref:Uncharacterized protein n=1 Tax=Stylosanthes scabra TaxID=79078 RepID=A0ABU6QPU8_9FABA|nr:hypothetical protein [Stylosanthes scabra]
MTKRVKEKKNKSKRYLMVGPRPVRKSEVSFQISPDRCQGNCAKFSLRKGCHRSATMFENTEYWTRVVLHRKQKQRDKPIIEFDPEIEKTLKKNRSRVKAQRTFQFEQEEVNSEEGASEKIF